MILIIADDCYTLEHLSALLVDHGYHTLSTAELNEADAILQQQAANIDAVLIDIHMAELHQHKNYFTELTLRHPHLKIFALSHQAAKSLQQHEDAQYFTAAIKRPIEESKLFASLNEHHVQQTDFIKVSKKNIILDRQQFLQAITKSLNDKTNTSIFLIDIKRFSRINQWLGLKGGDQLLIQIANALNAINLCQLARVSANSFALLTCVAEEEQTNIKQAIDNIFTTPFTINHKKIKLQYSLAIAHYPEHGNNAENLFKHAEQYVLQNKNVGFSHYIEDGNALPVAEALELEHALAFALDDKQLRIFYQPIIELATGKTAGIETLLRWQHPRLGLLAAKDFVALSKATGLIKNFDEWLFQSVLNNFKHNTNLFKGLFISFNLSPLMLEQDDIINRLQDFVKQTGINSKQLVIEITEDYDWQNYSPLLTNLTTIHKQGFSLALDDLGSGFASLAALKYDFFDYVKLDSNLVKDINKNPRSKKIIASMSSLADSLKTKVIVEGIEDKKQQQFIKTVAAHYGQGTYFKAPLNEQELTDYLMNNLK